MRQGGIHRRRFDRTKILQRRRDGRDGRGESVACCEAEAETRAVGRLQRQIQGHWPKD